MHVCMCVKLVVRMTKNIYNNFFVCGCYAELLTQLLSVSQTSLLFQLLGKWAKKKLATVKCTFV